MEEESCQQKATYRMAQTGRGALLAHNTHMYVCQPRRGSSKRP